LAVRLGMLPDSSFLERFLSKHHKGYQMTPCVALQSTVHMKEESKSFD
jgi:hypothetical protein